MHYLNAVVCCFALPIATAAHANKHATVHHLSSANHGAGMSGGQEKAHHQMHKMSSHGFRAVDIVYDVVVCGGGATGIIAATKLAEAGKTVLLVEFGGASTWETGGRQQNEIWKGTDVNIYDALGFTRSLWATENLNRTFFPDVGDGNQAAAVLGGGSAVNAGQQLYPHQHYFDTYLPEGWKYKDLLPAIKRLKGRLSSAASTSADGKLYNSPEIYRLTSKLLTTMGFREVYNVNDDLTTMKGATFGRQQFVSVHGRRGGPLVGYLPAALKLKNFKLLLKTEVVSLVRSGGQVSGVTAQERGSQRRVTYRAKNVVLAAGVFHTPKILFASGVGPGDVLDAFNIPKGGRILNDAIGRNVHDNPAFEIKLKTKGVRNVDARAAYEHPSVSDKAQYLSSMSGVLTNPNRIASFWLEQERPDGKGNMTIHGTCGPNGEQNPEDGLWACKFSLNEGTVSRTRFMMNAIGKISWPHGEPWSTEKVDVETHAAAIVTFQNGVKKYNQRATSDRIEVIKPLCYTTAECVSFIEEQKKAKKWKGNTHWGGSTKLGHDDATTGGTSAINPKTLQVYGLHNVFVIDGGLSPAPTTSNPAALYEIMAEHGTEKILAALQR